MAGYDPKHTWRLAKNILATHNINWLKTPPESPNLNPIENLWHELKEFNWKVVELRNKEELVEGIQVFWKTVNKAKCKKYIRHLTL